VNHDFYSCIRVFSFFSRTTTGKRVMTIEQLETLLVRPDPVGVGRVAPVQLPETFVHEQGKYRQTTLGGFIKNWLRIRAVLNVCTGRRARRLLRRASGFLVVGGVAYLGFLALVGDFRPVDRTRIIPADQQQATTRFDPKQAITPADQQQATISSRSMHDPAPEERSSYPFMSTPSDGAIEPLKNGPLVSPGENAAVPANDGGYVVQVSAERSDAKAQSSFKTLQSRYPHVLGDRSPLIRRVKLGKRGIFYRAQIGPFDTVEQAKQLCAKLKSAGGHCMVQKNS
jgi:cell division septation protein DedD